MLSYCLNSRKNTESKTPNIVKNTVPWTQVINDLNVEELVGTFYEKELQETNQKNLDLKT